jgi:urea transporter
LFCINIVISQLLQGSVLGVAQVIAVNDFACSAVVVAGMLLSSPLLAITGYLGSLLSTCLGEIFIFYKEKLENLEHFF